MKNPFIKNDTSGLWIAAVAISALAAGALTWIYLKRKETENAIEERHLDYPYEKHPHDKQKHHKSDINDLHTIVAPAHEGQ